MLKDGSNINYHSSNAAVNVDFKGTHNAQKNEERKISIDNVDKMALSFMIDQHPTNLYEMRVVVIVAKSRVSENPK